LAEEKVVAGKIRLDMAAAGKAAVDGVAPDKTALDRAAEAVEKEFDFP
jgi:hypothetical protein